MHGYEEFFVGLWLASESCCFLPFLPSTLDGPLSEPLSAPHIVLYVSHLLQAFLHGVLILSWSDLVMSVAFLSGLEAFDSPPIRFELASPSRNV